MRILLLLPSPDEEVMRMMDPKVEIVKGLVLPSDLS